ncbi:D-alanyl-D-alanine carboxypeptidase family protein [Sphaerimonospora thailandensis]|uniref:D-alanyl-D-alanine carboxypeptidase n=1 Tax=Sphaerimonospora thailandensis TaxID=795644 RepID=A0A8J3W088_9ACTN|nr:serine hydrolase [Sphaerimonospora thailandensis]GIH71327.1 D-alanyl-D-alanine carboxypeptidase [Sphaerimonospora thailandensis]
MRDGKVRFTVCAGLLAAVTGFTGIATPAHAQSSYAQSSYTQLSHASSAAHTLTVANDPPDVYGRAAYLLDATTGEALLTGNAGRRMPVASLTKVMTAYVVLREADPADKVKIIREDVEYAENNDGSAADLRPGDRLAVGDLLYALMLPSGADAAHALARTYGPGIAGFTAKMNAAARELGLRDTKYLNADGLPTPKGQGGVSTAQDQAKLAEVALRDPRLEEVTSTRRHHVDRTEDHRAYTWTNTNGLLGSRGVIGLKTGFTRAAGYCLTFAADRDGHRLIGVILGERQSGRRFQTARALLNWAEDNMTADNMTEGHMTEGEAAA